MRHVDPPAVDDEQVYDQITAAKQGVRRARLQAVRALVFGAYDAYAAAAPNVAHLPDVTLNDEQKKALLHAYEVETKPLARLRERLTSQVIVARCPLCGIGEASTLDHYLPKDEHPQFAIYSRNLIPSCSPCNTRKNALVVDKATNVRLFLHPYFDPIPEQHLISVQITLMPNALGITYRVRRPAGLTVPVFEHLQSHFRLLRLSDRYRVMSLEHLRSERKALDRFYGPRADADRVAAELAQQADDYEEDFGPNHWRVVLYRALAASVEFCDGGFRVLNSIQ